MIEVDWKKLVIELIILAVVIVIIGNYYVQGDNKPVKSTQSTPVIPLENHVRKVTVGNQSLELLPTPNQPSEIVVAQQSQKTTIKKLNESEIKEYENQK